MPRAKGEKESSQFVNRLESALADLEALPNDGARQLPQIKVSPNGMARNLENIYLEIDQVLIDSKRVYRYGNSLVLERMEGDSGSLIPLVTENQLQKAAHRHLANVFLLRFRTPDGYKQSTPSEAVVGPVLLREPTQAKLPLIKLYARRPIFDENFHWCEPGWNPAGGILVHGPAVPIAMPDICDVSESASVLDVLPIHVRTLLSEFCFASDADVANAVAVLLTGLSIHHFIDDGHPLVLLDGNQPGIGKTLLARVMGILLDGVDPRIINYTSNDEELGKRILATIRDGGSALVIDNAKVQAGTVINSPVIEANSVTRDISLRILQTSQNYVRPNDLLWFITMNDTRVSPDLTSRCIPIRFKYEGDPRSRKFENNPIGYAKRYRIEIIGELAGMVKRWDQSGRPQESFSHRLSRWARIIGGVLKVNGVRGFLANLDAATQEFNTELDDLAALAERAISAGRFVVQVDEMTDEDLSKAIVANTGKASEWERVFRDAEVELPKLDAARSKKAKAKFIGGYLGKFVDRPVDVTVRGQAGIAVLRKVNLRSNATGYCFEVQSAEDPTELEDAEGQTPEATSKPRGGEGRATRRPAIRTSDPTFADTSPRIAKSSSTLETCAALYADMELPKDIRDSAGDEIRLSYHKILNLPPEQIEPVYLEYLAKDALATYLAYEQLQIELAETLYSAKDAFGYVNEQWLTEQIECWGPQTHHTHLKGAVVLDAVTANGMHVDLEKIEQLRTALQSRHDELLGMLRPHGYLPGEEGCSKVLQRILGKIEKSNPEIILPRTATGKISISESSLEQLSGVDPFIDDYLEYEDTRKTLSTFLKKFAKPVLHPSFDPLLVSGRSSSFGDINAQNLPRNGGARECLIPSPGYVFINADYSGLEMATLSQAVLTQG